MFRKFYLILFLSAGVFGFSQNSFDCDSAMWAQDGTYELIKRLDKSEGTNSGKIPLTPETLCLIEQSRLDNEDVVLNFEYYDILIYSRNKKKTP